jgi:hypothetical protein
MSMVASAPAAAARLPPTSQGQKRRTPPGRSRSTESRLPRSPPVVLIVVASVNAGELFDLPAEIGRR